MNEERSVEQESVPGHILKDVLVLVAEDEEINYMFLEELLDCYDAKTLHARNGREAIELCSENNDIQLVLMDIKMPEVDGYQATQAIKKLKPQLPVIAQTAFAMDKDYEKAAEAGCDDFIAKPINSKVLVEKLTKWLEKGA